MRRHGFAQALLAPARRRWLAPFLAVVLCSPAIGSQRVLDDHVLELLATGTGDVMPRATGVDLFEFASGDVQQNLELMNRGALLPWWSDPALKVRFFRPLSSLSHRLDFALWPGSSELMYVHSLLWLALLVMLVACLYTRVEAVRPRVAVVAALLYAVSDVHGAVVGWLSNRNALLAASGAILCVLAQLAARREHSQALRWLSPRWLSPLGLGLALASGELGSSAWAFLVADAIALDRRPLVCRLAGLAPHLLVTGVWGAALVISGAGTAASGLYLHPLGDGVAFLRALPLRATLLVGGALGPLPAELTVLGSSALVPVAVAVAALAVAALLLDQRPRLVDPELRFWWIATVLTVLPVAASFPSNRLLVLTKVATVPIVSRVLVSVVDALPRLGPARALLAAFLFVTHVLCAPALCVWRARQMQTLGTAMTRAFACLDHVPDLEHKTLVVLGAPTDFFVSYLQVERAARRLPHPAHVYWVANPEAALDVRASDERSLSITRAGGFFVTPTEALYRTRAAALGAGSRVTLPELSAEVHEVTPSGAPGRIELHFAQPLGSQRYVFLEWGGAEYAPVSPSALAHLEVPPASLLDLLSPVSSL